MGPTMYCFEKRPPRRPSAIIFLKCLEKMGTPTGGMVLVPVRLHLFILRSTSQKKLAKLVRSTLNSYEFIASSTTVRTWYRRSQGKYAAPSWGFLLLFFPKSPVKLARQAALHRVQGGWLPRRQGPRRGRPTRTHATTHLASPPPPPPLACGESLSSANGNAACGRADI